MMLCPVERNDQPVVMQSDDLLYEDKEELTSVTPVTRRRLVDFVTLTRYLNIPRYKVQPPIQCLQSSS